MTNTAECIINHPIFAEAIAHMRAEAERGVIPLAELLDSAARERMVGAVVLATFRLPALPRPPQPRRISFVEWMDMQVMEMFAAQLPSPSTLHNPR